MQRCLVATRDKSRNKWPAWGSLWVSAALGRHYRSMKCGWGSLWTGREEPTRAAPLIRISASDCGRSDPRQEPCQPRRWPWRSWRSLPRWARWSRAVSRSQLVAFRRSPRDSISQTPYLCLLPLWKSKVNVSKRKKKLLLSNVKYSKSCQAMLISHCLRFFT